MAPQDSAEVLPRIPKGKKAGVSITEQTCVREASFRQEGPHDVITAHPPIRKERPINSSDPGASVSSLVKGGREVEGYIFIISTLWC